MGEICIDGLVAFVVWQSEKGLLLWRKFINRLALAWLNTEDGVKCRLVFLC